MEEKERYEIHIYDDVCVDLYNNGVLDKSINDTYKLEKLLNQQDKRIKELESEVKVGEFWHSGYQGKQMEYDIVYAELRKIMEENQRLHTELSLKVDYIHELVEVKEQLKKQLHDLPKKIVEEIRDVAGDYWEECGNVPDLYTLTMEDFDEILDAILEKFGDKNESNND